MKSSLKQATVEQRKAIIASLNNKSAEKLLFDWEFWARENQLPPSGKWLTWLLLAGRGFGKTRTGAEWVRSRVESGKARHIALVAPTAADARDVMVEGPAGILRVSSSSCRPIYEPSKRRLTWPNGASATTFSADEPERLRGPQHDTAWCDELGSWRYVDDAWSNLQLGLRLGDPRACVTTTPRAIKLIRELLSDPMTAKTRGSTFDNAANLADSFIDRLRQKYDGTRLGKQELYAELLEDTEGALWLQSTLDKYRVAVCPDLKRVIVAVDPATTVKESSAETGIIVAGIDTLCNGYVLEDASGHFTPAEWSELVARLYDKYRCDAVIAEGNQGGDMVTHVLRTTRANLPVKIVHASRGKYTRAEPIAALDEQGKIHHVGMFPTLEDQLCSWVPGEKSPDRMDARVWAMSELMLKQQVPSFSEQKSAFAGFRRRE